MKYYVVLFMLLSLLTGCASTNPGAPVYDPLEKMNRQVYRFNDVIDKKVLRPVAVGYRKVTPDIAEKGISNFFNNLDDANVFVNDILQGKFKQAASDGGRLFINSTVGILGLIDIGTRVGLEKHQENFGQTLGVWGIGEGPYLVVPFLGPKNLRSTVGWAIETQTTSATHYIDNNYQSWGLTGLGVIDLRAGLLSADQFLANALDPYLMIRDFWVQRHRQLTLDADQPAPAKTDNNVDELDELDALDAPNKTNELDELDELDKLDELDELDQLDELDKMDKQDSLTH